MGTFRTCQVGLTMSVHRETARALGIEVPPGLLLIADEVVE
jgi:hypothetical protein